MKHLGVKGMQLSESQGKNVHVCACTNINVHVHMTKACRVPVKEWTNRYTWVRSTVLCTPFPEIYVSLKLFLNRTGSYDTS